MFVGVAELAECSIESRYSTKRVRSLSSKSKSKSCLIRPQGGDNFIDPKNTPHSDTTSRVWCLMFSLWLSCQNAA